MDRQLRVDNRQVAQGLVQTIKTITYLFGGSDSFRGDPRFGPVNDVTKISQCDEHIPFGGMWVSIKQFKKWGSAICTLTLELFKVHMSLARELRRNGSLKYRSRIQCKAFSGQVGGDEYIASLLLGYLAFVF